MRNRILFISIIITMISCTAQKEEVDLIVHNAMIYTVDPGFSKSESFAIKDGIFVAIGSNKDVLNRFTAKDVIDAEGKWIYPGFIDAHCHFYGYGLGLLKRADLVGTKSFDEVLARLVKHNEGNPAKWLEGRGWDQNDWEIQEFPHKEKLDQLFPDKPVVITRIDGHAALANSEALKRAGIGPYHKIEGGEIESIDGELTGILLDNAIDLVTRLIPKPDMHQRVIALVKAQENCFAAGLTMVVDAGLSYTTINLIDSLHQSGELKIRMDAMLSPTEENFGQFMEKGIYETDRLHVGSVKLFADGALGSRGACLCEPYTDQPDKIGFLINTPEYYLEICNLAYKHGSQVNTHAIGDSGVRLTLNTYATVLKGKNDRRWRIEHSQVVHPDDFDLYGKYSIIPSVQATHATSDMYWAGERVGEERLKGAYAYKQLLDQNGWLPNGTDFPVEEIYPLFTFYASVARKDLEGWPKDGWQMENALSREEALKSMTIWAAKGSFMEDKVGSIEPGKQADFVILDEDIMDAEESILPHIKVMGTYISGEKVYGE